MAGKGKKGKAARKQKAVVDLRVQADRAARAQLAQAASLKTSFSVSRVNHLPDPEILTMPVRYSYPSLDGTRRSSENWNSGTVACVALPWRESPSDYVPPEEPGAIHIPSLWTEELVRAWLDEALETLRLCRGDRPAGARSGMPDVVREAVEAYGYGEVATRRHPTLDELARLDVVLPWLFMVEDLRSRKALVGVAMGINLRRLGRALGCSHTHAGTLARQAVARLTAELNAGR